MITSERISDIINQSITTKEHLLEYSLGDIKLCGDQLVEVYKNNAKLLLCGNGGSAADAQHIAAELVIRFRGNVQRRALPALSLGTDPSLVSAGGNDIGYENTFARAVEAFGNKGDALIAISTSGNSKNVQLAVEEAKKRGVLTIGLLGNGGGLLAKHCDYSVIVPSSVTARIQECHIMIGHIWCEMIEEALFPELFKKN